MVLLNSPRRAAVAVALALALALALLPAASLAADSRIAADALLPLDGAAWSAAPASDPSRAIAASVPGDVVSDLAAAGVIATPWLDLTWRDEAARWDEDSWTYALSFATPAGWAPASPGDEVYAVFDSVKMAADISLNGHAVGSATSQHRRYLFAVGALLAPAGGANNNSLSVVFPPTVSDARNDDGRYVGCAGGW